MAPPGPYQARFHRFIVDKVLKGASHAEKQVGWKEDLILNLDVG